MSLGLPAALPAESESEVHHQQGEVCHPPEDRAARGGGGRGPGQELGYRSPLVAEEVRLLRRQGPQLKFCKNGCHGRESTSE